VQISRLNNGGFTLVELMVAMLITLVGLVGLLQSVNIAMEHNLRNQLRDEAVAVGEKIMSFQMVRPYTQLSTSHIPLLNSQLRSGAIQYRMSCNANPSTATSPTPPETLVTVTVKWNYKGVPYRHQVRSMRSSE
jgi:type IV pilus assembly protein PilV